MGKRKQERIGITLQLVRGRDDDLINWLASVPENERSATLRHALRHALGLPLPAPAQTAPALDIDAIRQAIDAAIDSRLADLPTYIADVVRQYANGQPIAEPESEPAPQVDAATLEARINNLRKQKW